MKKIFSLLILLISLLSFGQRKEYKQAVNLFNDKKYEESLVIVDKLLNKEFGNLTEEQEFYSLQMRINCYNSLKNYKKAYDVALPYLAFIKNSKSLFFEETKIKAIDEAEKTLEFYKSKLSSEQSISSNISTNSSTIQNTEAKSTSDNKTVTLMVSGTGKTLEEAKLNALRSAIEQAFGAFISSKTEILNDSIVKDEVVSVTNGNIQKYDVISQVEIPDNGYAITLKAIVSIEKLTSFVENKGFSVEFKGGLFAFNVKQQILNEENENKSIQNLLVTLKKIIENSLDYKIKADNPISNSNDNVSWYVPLTISFSINENFSLFYNYLVNTLRGLAMSSNEVDNYKALGKNIYSLNINGKQLHFRKEESVKTILTELNFYFVKCVLESKIESSISSNTISSFKKIDVLSSFNPVGFKTDSTNFDYMWDIKNIFKLVEYFKWINRDFNYNSVNLTRIKSYSGGYYFTGNVNYNLSDGDNLVVIKVNINYSLDDLNRINGFDIAKYIGQ